MKTFGVIIILIALKEIKPEASEKHFVSYFDCNVMSDTEIYSINTVPKCDLEPETLSVAPVKFSINIRQHVQKTEGTRCRLNEHLFSWNCMDKHTDGFTKINDVGKITKPHALTGRQCKDADKDKKIDITVVNAWGESHKYHKGTYSPTFKYDEKTTEIHMIGEAKWGGKSYNGDCSWGTAYQYTTESFMEKINLTYHAQTGDVLDVSGFKLACKYSEGECDANSVDAFAYFWDIDDNCVLVKQQEAIGKMVKWQGRYFIISEKPAMKVEIKPSKRHFCNSDKDFFQTNFLDLFIDYEGGYDVFTGARRISIKHTELNEDKFVSFDNLRLQVNDTVVNAKGEEVELQVNNRLNQAVKIDFVNHRISEKMHEVELESLKRDCELERTQILTILMLAVENERLAGYMLTGNRSTFLEVDGATAWLFKCKKELAPLNLQNRCYDRIPIETLDGKLKFVDPITRQLTNIAKVVECEEGNYFQLDPEIRDSWFKIGPDLAKVTPPLEFTPRNLHQKKKFDPYSLANSDLYSQEQQQKFWDKIVSAQQGDYVMKNLVSNIIYNPVSGETVNLQKRGSSILFGPQLSPYYLDNFLSPDFFGLEFISHFGIVCYWLEKLGIFFACFLFLKLILEVLISLYRALELKTVTHGTVTFGRTLLYGFFNLAHLGIFTPIFKTDDNPEDRIKLKAVDQKIASAPVETEMYSVIQNGHEKLYPDSSEIPVSQMTTFSYP